MTRFAIAFWAIAGIDALVLLVLLAMTLQSSAGQHDGGREMGLFFFILLPGAALAIAMLLFRFAGSTPVKGIALAIAVAPWLWIAEVKMEDAIVDRRIAADRLGVGYFEGPAMKAMGAAVVRHDVAEVLRLRDTVDVNTPGRDMTLLALAVSGPDDRHSDSSELPMVRALLQLGAKPDPAMHTACVRESPELLEILLAAGGHANLTIGEGQPLVFDTMSSITPRNFQLLAAHGLDLNVRSQGDPLPVELAIYRRWDLLAIAIELGADTAQARPDGRTVASELASQAEEATKEGRAIPAELANARAVLAARTPSR